MINAFHIDAFEFCRLKESREGELALSDLPRLAEELVDPAGSLRWTLQGGQDTFGHAQLVLTVTGDVKLRCQRCLAAMPFSIASESVLVLARDEAGADGIEELLDDEAIDVIVGSASLDVLALIEDDALLALPLAPRHAACPEGASLPQEKVEKESPFAVLKKLKQ